MFLDFASSILPLLLVSELLPIFTTILCFSSFLLRGNKSKPALVNKAHSVLKNKDEMGFPWYHLV